MKKVSTVEARGQFSDLINRAAYGKERIVLTRRGRDLAAMVPMDDLELLEELEEKIDIEEARRAWREQGRKPARSWKKVKKAIGVE